MTPSKNVTTSSLKTIQEINSGERTQIRGNTTDHKVNYSVNEMLLVAPDKENDETDHSQTSFAQMMKSVTDQHPDLLVDADQPNILAVEKVFSLEKDESIE